MKIQMSPGFPEVCVHGAHDGSKCENKPIFIGVLTVSKIHPNKIGFLSLCEVCAPKFVESLNIKSHGVHGVHGVGPDCSVERARGYVQLKKPRLTENYKYRNRLCNCGQPARYSQKGKPPLKGYVRHFCEQHVSQWVRQNYEVVPIEEFIIEEILTD